MTSRVGVDTGGTFTDMIACNTAGRFQTTKVLSTPRDPSQATLHALRKAHLDAPGEIATLVHGTTIATNALVERRGAVVGLITTAGFRDVLRIQRGGRPRSFDMEWVKPLPLVPRHLTYEARERIGPDGAIRGALNEQDVRDAARALKAQGVEVVAVSFLFSFLNPMHERRARELLLEEEPELIVSISSEVFGQWREYERTSTCVIDAFLKPTVDRYARDLEALTAEQGVGEFLIMRSNGGAMTPDGARALPVSMVRSGPAGGVIASLFIGELCDIRNLIIGDMGGTSFDTCLIQQGLPALTTQAEVEWGIPISIPMVDVRSIGAGGGSIAWLDAAGIMHVGPQSAGADPGPACYGRGGTEATVTDANLILGRLSADVPLAGDVKLDRDAGVRAIAPLAVALGRSVEETALGIIRIADNNMAQALRLVSIDRGNDPRDFVLIAFGGAGPLHASALARALSMKQILVPIYPGTFSAFGAMIADARFDYRRTSVTRDTANVERITAVFQAMENQAAEELARERLADAPAFLRSIDVRYAGQNWELEVPVSGAPGAASLAAARDQFHLDHATRFGWNMMDGELEFVHFKLRVQVTRPKPEIPELDSGPVRPPTAHRSVLFDGDRERRLAPVFWRDDLRRGNVVHGPSIIAEMDATVLLGPGDVLEVDRYGNLIITIAQGEGW